MTVQAFDSSYFGGKSHFEGDGTHNYLVFQPISRYFKTVANTVQVTPWKTKGLSDENIKPLLTSNNSLNLATNYFDNSRIRGKFDGNCLKQEKLTFTHNQVVNIYIVYEKNLWSFTVGQDLTQINSLLGAVKLTTNADPDKYQHSTYGIRFDASGGFSLSYGSRFSKNVIIFGADISSSVHINNKKKDIFILGKGPTQGFYNTKLTAEKEYSINFTEQQKKFCLSLHYDGVNSYIFVNGVEIYKFKAKDSEINAAPLCLGNVSTDFSADNMKRTGLYEYVYDFSVD